MQLIGRGYHYKVFDLGNGRVRKVARSIWDKFLHPPGRETIWRSECAKWTVPKLYRRLLSQAPTELLASPVFFSSLNYEQDKVTILGLALEAAPSERQHQIIDAYIAHVLECWRYGFADMVFNFTINNGLDNNGNVALIDFNEVTFDKAEVARRISIKRWLTAASYLRLDPGLQPYYRGAMEQAMTAEALERNWRAKCGV